MEQANAKKQKVDHQGSVTKLSAKQRRASDFVASLGNEIENVGLNGCFPAPLLPEIVKDAMNAPLDPSDVNRALQMIKKSLIFSFFCLRTKEKGTNNSVSQILAPSLNNFFDMYSKQDVTVKLLNATDGCASVESIPDFVVKTSSDPVIALAVIELKDTTKSPLEQMGQAIAYGTNIVLSHLRMGLRYQDCAVPLVLTNGNLYQFAWVTLLEPSFPVSHVSTGVYDASIPENRNIIAQQLAIVKAFCSRTEGLLAGRERAISELDNEISNERYFMKDIDNVFLRWENDFDRSILYMWRVVELLADNEYAVLPLCIANILGMDGKKRRVMIFPKLVGYMMGVPADKGVLQLYLESLKQAILCVHKSRVVHVDLYPSNIMWYYDGENMHIRFVDWDAATQIGDKFTDVMAERMDDSKYKNYHWSGKSNAVADVRCDFWHLFILSHLTDQEILELNGDADNVNRVYYEILTRHDKDSNLKEKFELWYQNLVHEMDASE
ncbi:hypothetical protein HDV01_003135 [Terramyces sp. JEL0728]|nr:hypothetical protein HDV01_003135 [Terramyces sp. JEL0728]